MKLIELIFKNKQTLHNIWSYFSAVVEIRKVY